MVLGIQNQPFVSTNTYPSTHLLGFPRVCLLQPSFFAPNDACTLLSDNPIEFRGSFLPYPDREDGLRKCILLWPAVAVWSQQVITCPWAAELLLEVPICAPNIVCRLYKQCLGYNFAALFNYTEALVVFLLWVFPSWLKPKITTLLMCRITIISDGKKESSCWSKLETPELGCQDRMSFPL